jgi:hypothetical protein
MESSLILLRVVRGAEILRGQVMRSWAFSPRTITMPTSDGLDPFLTNRPRSPEKCSRGEPFARLSESLTDHSVAVAPVERE